MQKSQYVQKLALYSLCSLTTFAYISPLHANTAAPKEQALFQDFYNIFKEAKYNEAINYLNKNEKNPLFINGQLHYFKGLTLARMQEYTKAVEQFKLAIKNNNKAPDLYYEYGQALYASNNLDEAILAFEQSAKNSFNKETSLYYIAYINQLYEKFDIARDYYAQVLKTKDLDPKLSQVTRFQLSEVLLSLARAKSTLDHDLQRRVDRFILPQMQQAFEIDPKSSTAPEIYKRIAELKVEFKLDPDLMENGRRIPSKRFSAFVEQNFSYDNNITLTSQENNVQQTKKGSIISETEGYAKYTFPIKKQFLINPEVRMTYIKHADTKNAEVYQNDSFVTHLNLKNSYEHTLFFQEASFLFDIEYAKTKKDWNAKKSLEDYADSVTFSVGEAFNYFPFGETTVRLKRRAYKGTDQTISNNTTSISVDQVAIINNKNVLIGLFDASFIDNFNNSITSSNSYFVRADYIMPEFWKDYTLGVAFGLTLTDTLDMKAVRGNEFTYNPSFNISKYYSQRLRGEISYNFTKNTSDSVDYEYDKHVINTELRYTF